MWHIALFEDSCVRCLQEQRTPRSHAYPHSHSGAQQTAGCLAGHTHSHARTPSRSFSHQHIHSQTHAPLHSRSHARTCTLAHSHTSSHAHFCLIVTLYLTHTLRSPGCSVRGEAGSTALDASPGREALGLRAVPGCGLRRRGLGTSTSSPNSFGSLDNLFPLVEPVFSPAKRRSRHLLCRAVLNIP